MGVISISKSWWTLYVQIMSIYFEKCCRWNPQYLYYLELEIKTFGINQTLPLSAEVWAEVTCLISYSSEVIAQIWWDPQGDLEVIEQLLSKPFFKKIYFFMLFWPSQEGFWPLTASITLEVKKKLCLCYNGKDFDQNQWYLISGHSVMEYTCKCLQAHSNAVKT